MAVRPPYGPSSSTSHSYSAAAPAPFSGPQPTSPAPPSPTMSMRSSKRQRTAVDMHGSAAPEPHGQPTVGEDAFINDDAAADSGGDDDDDDEKPKTDKKAGRRKIKIEFIQDKSRRHITFSKRKAGIMKKAYELSTLTGTQVLLLVVSETGLVYTFTTAKLQPLVTQPEGKNLIQACLNAPPGALPSSHPVGPTMNRAAPMPMPGPPQPTNLPGGLSISPSSAPKDDNDDDDPDDSSAPRAVPNKRRRRASSNAAPARGPTSPHSQNASIPPLNIPSSAQSAPPPHQHPQPPQSQISLGSPTSPQQQHQQVPASSPAQYSPGSYAHHPGQPHQQHDPGLYGSHMSLAGGYSYSPGGGPPPQGGPGQQAPLGGLAAAAAAQHSHWSTQQPQVGQGGHYGRR